MCIAKVICAFNHLVFLMQRGLLKCLSRVMGNYHARVLRGRSGSNATPLPDFSPEMDRYNRACPKIINFSCLYDAQANSADTQSADCIKTEHSCAFPSVTPYFGRNSPVSFFLRSCFFASFLCSLLLLLILLLRLWQPRYHPNIMRKHCPGNTHLPGDESFAPQRAS